MFGVTEATTFHGAFFYYGPQVLVWAKLGYWISGYIMDTKFLIISISMGWVKKFFIL